MIYEQRTYSVTPAGIRPLLALYEREGLPILQRHLGRLIAFFITETGELNQVTHLWAYQHLNDREERRTALWRDPDWLVYAEKVLPLITRMESRILKPAAFSPLQ